MFLHGQVPLAIMPTFTNNALKKLDPEELKKNTLAFQSITGLELNKTEAGKEHSLTRSMAVL